MDDAISLLNRWLDAEYAASLAMWRERDDTRYYELLANEGAVVIVEGSAP